MPLGGCTSSPPVFLQLVPSGLGPVDDDIYFLQNFLIKKPSFAYLGTQGKIVATQNDAAQFVIVYCDDGTEDSDDDDDNDDDDNGTHGGHIAEFNTDTGKLTYYGKSRDTTNPSFTFSSTYNDLFTQDLNGTFGIRYDEDSPLFPYAQNLEFHNTVFGTCDNNAVFGAAFADGKFKLGGKVIAITNIGAYKGYQKLHLYVQCVKANCFVAEQGDQCPASAR